MKRIDGIVVIIIGLLYGWGSAGILESKVGIQSRVGSSTFPLGIAFLFVLCGLMILIRGDGVDHRHVWPTKQFWKPFVILVGVLLLYGLLFDTVGFLIINTALCVYLGILLKARPISSLGSGLIISFFIFIVFNIILEINLAFGLLSFMEDWIYGY